MLTAPVRSRVSDPLPSPLPPQLDERLRNVRLLRQTLARHPGPLLEAVGQEIHKPRFEALTSDLMPLLAACRWHERHAASALRPTRLGGGPFWLPGQRWRVHRRPLGRVGIIATWNYPVQLLGVQMLQALIAGNTVVVKPSEHAPRTQALLMEAFHAAGFGEPWLSSRPATRQAGQAMLRDEQFDHVVFTGSTGVGRQVAAWAAEEMVTTTLELSGADSAIVFDDADAALAARAIWNAVTLNGGQTCMAPRRALVDRRVYPAFLAALAPLAAAAQPRRLISAAAAAAGFELVAATLTAHPRARSLSGVAEPPAGATVRPLAIADCPADAPLACREHFAPFLAVIPVDSADEALAVHAAAPQLLATSVFTRRPRRLAPRLDSLRTGLVTINDCVLPTAHPACSIVGRGQSGWSPSRGREGLLAMTRAVQVSQTPRGLRPPTTPPTPSMASRLERLALAWYARSR